MEGKLIKTDGHYFLEVEPCTLSTRQKHTIIANTFDKPKGDILQLSLSNCQAIERGYDLDELAKIQYPICEVWNDEEALIRKLAFKKGFQQALEILGDKKFSEDDVRKIIHWSTLDKDVRLSEKELFQSLQQTEWDVEVEMTKEEYTWTPPGEGFEDQTYRDWREVPLLDQDGCLILKRVV